MSVVLNDQLSPREHILLENEKEQAEKGRQHALAIKQLELEIKRQDNAAKVALKELESRWASWLKIPSLIIRLPLFIILGLAYCIAVARKYDPPKKFWELLE